MPSSDKRVVITMVAILVVEIITTFISWRARPRASMILVTLLILQIAVPGALWILDTLFPAAWRPNSDSPLNFGVFGQMGFLYMRTEFSTLAVGAVASPLILISVIIKKKKVQPAAGALRHRNGAAQR